MKKSLFIILIIFGIIWGSHADNRVYLLHSDVLYFDNTKNRDAQFLVGHVQFKHDNALMYCDSALFYEASNSFDAYGHVRLVQGDTLNLIGDVLYYNGLEKLARVRHNVVLTHRTTKVYTDSMDYDRLYNIGYFFEGGHLVDANNDLTSDWGEYSPNTREAVFNYNVRMVSPPPPKKAETTLLTDTLRYDTRTGIGHATGPSTIDNGACHIYSTSAFMNPKDRNLTLFDRSELNNNGKKLIGDKVIWNSTDSIGEAFGNVHYTDIVNKNTMTGGYCYYNEKTGYSMGTDSARILDYSQGKDTMYLHGDTIKLFTYHIKTDSAYRTMHTYHKVRMFREDLQGVCDSLVYNKKTLQMTMYRDPVVWSKNQQILGEEIIAFMNDSTVDSIQVLRQTLLCERLDSMHYNQISGHEIHSYFDKGKIKGSHTIGNVYVKYYPLDSDSLMIGLNHCESTEMKMFMGDNQKVKRIWMPAATGTLYPIFKIPPKQRFLDNFIWFDYMRPKNPADIFNWRGKTKGSELKESKQRKAPLQQLNTIKKDKNNGTVQDKGTPQVPQSQHLH